MSLAVSAFLLWGFFGFVTQIHGQDGFTQVAIEKYFLNIEHQNEYVNLYGAMQRLLGKKQIEKFTIFKTEYDKLVAPRKELTEEDTKLKFEELYLIIAYLVLCGKLSAAAEIRLSAA